MKTIVCCSSKRSASQKISNWSTLHSDLLLGWILNRLSFVDILRFGAVCSPWRYVAKSYVSSLSYDPLIHPPMLLLPSGLGDDDDDFSRSCFSRCKSDDAVDLCLFNFPDEKCYPLVKKEKKKKIGPCVGSSHGWMIYSDERPYLYNPISGVSIELPSLVTFPRFTGNIRVGKIPWVLKGTDTLLEYEAGSSGIRVIGYLSCPRWIPLIFLRNFLIDKAVLSSDPSRSDSCRVVVVYNLRTRLAFSTLGNGDKWADLQVSHKRYADIIWCKDQLYAVSETASLEVWDFNHTTDDPVKKMDIEPYCFFFKSDAEMTEFPKDLYSKRYYIVESLGDILLLVRYIANHVCEEDPTHPILKRDIVFHHNCPYMTTSFRVYKLDFDRTIWEEVGSLHDRMIFLGGAHSMSVPGHTFPKCHQNSIFFTDDNWIQIGSNDFYGGHDMGRFNMEDKSIKQIYEVELQGIEPPPFWVLPNPW